MEAQKHDYVVRIVTVGESGVGKSSIVTRMAKNEFKTPYSTLGIDFLLKTIEVNGARMKIQLWDSLGGRDRMIRSPSLFYRRSMGILLIYDTAQIDSFERLECFITEMEQHAPPNSVKMILGNKCDLTESRAVTTERGKELADKHGYKFMEVSAKTGQNTEQALLELASEIKIQKDSEPNPSTMQKPATEQHSKKEARCF